MCGLSSRTAAQGLALWFCGDWSRTAWVSWHGLAERAGQSSAHCGDGIRHVAFRPQRRRGNRLPARRSGIHRPRCTAWQHTAPFEIPEPSLQSPARVPDSRVRSSSAAWRWCQRASRWARFGGERREPIFARLVLALGPFDQQPLLGAGRGAQRVAVRGADTQRPNIPLATVFRGALPFVIAASWPSASS